MKRILGLAIVVVVLGVEIVFGGKQNPGASSSIPHLINYQGVLTTPAGTPVLDGTYDILFTIYDAAQGGNLEWDHTYSVAVTKGLFNVILGESEPIDVPFDEDYWLEIKVGSDPPLLPRIRITSVGYAYRAEVANTAAVAGSGGGWVDDGTVVRLESDSDQVGIGTEECRGKLTIERGHGTWISLRASQNNNFWCIHNPADADRLEVGLHDGQYHWGLFVIQNNGHVGIGTTNPAAKLHVSGGAWDVSNTEGDFKIGDENYRLKIGVARGGLGAGDVRIRAHGGTNNLMLGAGSSDVLFIKGTGNVGIGTTSPSRRLTVRGNILVQSANTGAAVMELGEGLDYAEGFDVSDHEEVTPGAVLVIDQRNPGKLSLSTRPYDSKVAGIVAGGKGLGSAVRVGVGQFDFDIALAGRVYCNVDATEAGVKPGDLLTTSATPGYAMKVTDRLRAHGAILGKAMEKLEKGQKGQIMVLVTLQ